MQVHLTEPLPRIHDAPDLNFKHTRHSLAYDDIHLIRHEMAEFFRFKGVSDTHIGNLTLTLTEILSNLVRHPAGKADYIEIRADITGQKIRMEVLDSSTPFANFDAKCKTAMSRLHASVTESENGYGLGCIMTLCKNPVYIPAGASPDHLNHFKVVYDTRAAGPPAAPRPDRKKIFLVDDDLISIEIHRRMLDGVYEVIAFDRAEEALDSFAKHQPDLIISDLTMPGMDGIALRRALDGVAGGNTTPFIFLSGHSDRENSPYISQLGVDDFLCKPVSGERLHAILTRLLKRSQQIRSSIQGQFHHDITELLKPAMPEGYGGWKFTTRHVVADAGGGDFILHQQTPAHLMTVLADVMGHGRQAKFFSYVYAGYLRSMFRLHAGSLDASGFLKNLSQSIDGDALLESTALTCQCFQFFPDGALKIASAGHPCPILLNDRRIELVDVMGPLPGLVGDTPYDMKTVRLTPGGKVIFMTDGFLEVFDRQGRAAQEFLKRVQDAPAASSPALADHLWREYQMMQMRQPRHHDDATIIIAEYGGE